MWNATRIRRALVSGALLALAVSPAALAQDNAYALRTLVVNRPELGNFGDGIIVAFDRGTGQQIDDLRDPRGAPLAIDGLWAIFSGNGASLGPLRLPVPHGRAQRRGGRDLRERELVNTPNPDPAP
jgi:hypothetical protein